MHPDIIAYNEAQLPEDQPICQLLAEQIDLHLSGAESKVWHAHPVWFLEGNPIVGYSRRKSGMNLMFWSGQSFDEPILQPEGKFKAAEIRYGSVEEINSGDLQRWLRKGREIQWDYKNIVKRKGVLERII
ncbi:DUF1801 domain-containing protein [Taibaiella koreensis]|uniref:DUF1801 domain-containing protein n=1 Tax=Taibaiella koreensis TaxID=1268548 RepID=UPI000E5990DA|nr:DUF1801 domain-containing protein [Taibaiella koreensis]